VPTDCGSLVFAGSSLCLADARLGLSTIPTTQARFRSATSWLAHAHRR
jgi:hypothetical protein